MCNLAKKNNSILLIVADYYFEQWNTCKLSITIIIIINIDIDIDTAHFFHARYTDFLIVVTCQFNQPSMVWSR